VAAEQRHEAEPHHEAESRHEAEPRHAEGGGDTSSRDVDTARLEAPRFEPASTMSWSSAVPQNEPAPGAQRSE
jgi:hypothetical protein